MAETTKNKVKYGLENVYYAKLTGETYAIPVPIEGAVSISLKASGDTAPVYADNVEYFSFETNNGYDGSIEFVLIPDDFKTDILGEVVDKNGVTSESSDAKVSEFALLFQFKGDLAEKRHVLYRCKCTRPNIESETVKEKTENKNESLDIKCRPVISGVLKHQIKANVSNTAEQKAIYDAWFTKVYDGTVIASE
jgi:phi13 family phage major tail protein